MLVAERGRALQRRLSEKGSVRISAEAERFGVSEETIRRDIKRLAAIGFAVPVFGGAVLSDAEAGVVPPLSERRQETAKSAIALAARNLVQPGQVVILDAGTTTLALAHALRDVENLTFVTNSLTVASVCAEIPLAVTYVIGGRLMPGSLSMIGPQAGRELAEVNADWAFLGAAAVEIDGSFTSGDPYEADVKRAMIKAARRVAILADATKFGVRRLAAFARIEDVDCLVTTTDCPEETRRWVEAAGAELIMAEEGTAP